MKRKLIMMICLGIIASVTSGVARPLELVTLQYPPYEYKENGEIKGIAVEIVRTAFHKMKQPIKIKLYPWSRAIRKVEIGDSDAIFTAYKNPSREKFSDFSKEVLMPQVISLFVVKDSPIKFDGDLSKLAKYNFGAVREVSYGSVFDQAVKSGKIPPPELISTGEHNMRKLLGRRFEILVSNKYGALYILKKMNKLDQVRELSPQIQSVPSYIAFSKKRNLASIRDKFDVVLAQMKQDGTYDKIIKDFFK